MLFGSLVESEQVVHEDELAQVAHFEGHGEQILPFAKYPVVQAQLLFKELKSAPVIHVRHLFEAVGSHVAQNAPWHGKHWNWRLGSW